MTFRRTDPKRTRRAALVAGLAAFALAACNVIAGLDQEYALVENAELDAEAGPDQVADAPPPPVDAPPTGDAGFDAKKTCPSGRGPEMILIDDTYCIDSTEVTERQYAAFLDAGLETGCAFLPSSGVCAWKKSFVPENPDGPAALCRWNPTAYPNLPVVCVDWCDAYAFCAWAGKRLCGAIGGGPIPWDPGADTDAGQDQWYRACSGNGARRFPYGDDHAPSACNDKGRGTVTVLDAGSLPDCKGGYDGLFDMVGNAFELVDSCEDGGADPRAERCKTRGGSWNHSHTSYSSCTGIGRGDRRDLRTDDIGIRCCAD